MFFAVLSVLRCNASDQWIRRVAISKQRANREQHFGDGQCGTPVIFEDIQANDALAVNVAVVDARAKGHLWGLERILGRKMDIKEKYASFINRAWWTQNR